jgi:predicted dehydrogenase
MMDFGCHRIEVLTDLFGSVVSQRSLATKSAFPERGVEDSAALLLEFEHGPLASVTVTHAAIEPKDTLSIYGTEGSIDIANLNAGNITIKTASDERTESYPSHANFHFPLIDDFSDAIMNDREPCVGGETGRMVALIEDKIYGRA